MLHKFISRVRPPKSGHDGDAPNEGYPVVDPYFWTPKVGVNFGDYLASAVVQRMLAARELLVNEPVSRHRRLFSVGSVLHFAQTGDTIWGTGRNGKIAVDRHRFETLDIRAVRGPLTRRFLNELGHSVPEIYGDPALLIPKLFPNRFRRRSGGRALGIVPNLHDTELVEGDNVIDPTWRWDAVISAICECDFIVSSSLHGLVIADAFGIPCAHLRLSDTEPDFKYIDYCEGAGRSEFWSSTSVAEALDRGPLPPIAHDAEALMAAFPYDLWDA
jgi:pyruvyltransferase